MLPGTGRAVPAVVERLEQQQAIDGVVLAGSKLSLLMENETHFDLPVLDTVRIHAQAAIDALIT
jgi:aspartate/glutamate racemase